MFLQAPPEDDAAAALYRGDIQDDGYVMNLTRLWAWRPQVCESFTGLRKALVAGSALRPREWAVLVCASAATLGDSYCALAWGKRLADESDPDTAAAVLGASEAPALDARERALCEWARKVVRSPNATRAEDVQRLRAAGLGEREIFEATAFIAFRVAFSTVNDALGARPDLALAEAAPGAVRAAVTYGRPVDEPAPA
jgi:uncharacterized peroxidase-related enzyme